MLLPAGIEDFIKSDEGFLLREDVIDWTAWYGSHEWYRGGGPEGPVTTENLVFHADKLFSTFPEFRSLYDYRVKQRKDLKSCHPSMPRATDFYINCPSIGPRFRIQHGHSTYVFAREVGSDFFINHNCTVGANGGVPKIGNRVKVRTGAVVVGPITIGDDVLITANAVVSTDVGSGYNVYAPRSVIKKRKNA